MEKNMKFEGRNRIPGIRKRQAPLFASMWMALFIALRHEYLLARAPR